VFLLDLARQAGGEHLLANRVLDQRRSVVGRVPPVILHRMTRAMMPRVMFFVDAGECHRVDVQAGFVADLAAQAVVDGLAEFEDAAGRFPAVVVAALDEQRTDWRPTARSRIPWPS
jgi:hypothetical protein